jgi:hypothetical protein
VNGDVHACRSVLGCSQHNAMRQACAHVLVCCTWLTQQPTHVCLACMHVCVRVHACMSPQEGEKETQGLQEQLSAAQQLVSELQASLRQSGVKQREHEALVVDLGDVVAQQKAHIQVRARFIRLSGEYSRAGMRDAPTANLSVCKMGRSGNSDAQIVLINCCLACVSLPQA